MKNFIFKIAIVMTLGLLNGCVQKTHLKTLQFIVGTKGLEQINSVGIRGGEKPLSWDETTFLSDADGDGIFELNLKMKSANPGLEFKFVNQDDQFELQDKNNRQLTFEYKPETIIYKTSFNDAEHSVTSK